MMLLLESGTQVRTLDTRQRLRMALVVGNVQKRLARNARNTY